MLLETPLTVIYLHLSFIIFVYGIENPVERVTLKNPKGEVEDLASIDDQYLISSDCFVLYNDLVNHLKYEGNYEITIYANGFQTFLSFLEEIFLLDSLKKNIKRRIQEKISHLWKNPWIH